ncbi:MAG: PilT/PilU family type 4a pilus ATPase [Peptostreptococcaceae bacterium]|nr:PilT/PilU family type 4a pilus ATPase [Peptostreptococcaceae bacterium]
MEIKEILRSAIDQKTSDILIVAGCNLAFKINNQVIEQSGERLMPDATKKYIMDLYDIAGRSFSEKLEQKGDDDFSFSISSIGRFRCSAYKQRGSYAAVLRVVSFELPSPEERQIPKTVTDLFSVKKGLVLVTGSAGSGKSTTLACIVDKINKNRFGHIITIEDPIEFVHRHDRSIVSQRELEHDTVSYESALRAALRQAPNVILIGEMRDFETIQTAITASETGQLVLSTLHTIGAAKSIDRIIDVFPAGQQQQVRVQLSMELQAVVSQQLIPSVDGGLVPAFEIMLVNNAIRNMIKDSKINQIDNVIQASGAEGMVTMDNYIFDLYKQGKISKENALRYAINSENLKRRL